MSREIPKLSGILNDWTQLTKKCFGFVLNFCFVFVLVFLGAFSRHRESRMAQQGKEKHCS